MPAPSLHEIEIDQIPSDHPIAVFTQYFGKHKNRHGLLVAEEVDVLTFPTVLPWVLILDELGSKNSDDHTFIYRFVGTGCATLFGVDYTGFLFGDSLPPEATEARYREFLRVQETRKPIYTYTSVPLEGREFKEIYRCCFPATKSRSDLVDRFYCVIAETDRRIRPRP